MLLLNLTIGAGMEKHNYWKNGNKWYLDGEEFSFNPRFIPALIQKKKCKPLSIVCSKLYKLQRETEYAMQEIEQFHAPSECASLVYRSAEKEIDKTIKESGFLCREVLMGVLKERISYKWIYNNLIV